MSGEYFERNSPSDRLKLLDAGKLKRSRLFEADEADEVVEDADEVDVDENFGGSLLAANETDPPSLYDETDL